MEEIEVLYKCLDDSTQLIRNKLHKNYIDALFITTRNILEGKIELELSNEDILALEIIYQGIDDLEMTKEAIRQATAFSILKGMQEDNIKNSEFTPDVAVLLISYLVQKLVKDYDPNHEIERLAVIDPCVGTANLLTGVMNCIPQYEIDAFGFDIVSNSIKLGQITSDLQGNKIDFVIEDFIESNIKGFDLGVFDASLYLYNDEYFPQVLVQHLIGAVKDGAYMIGLIPNDFFEVEGDVKTEILKYSNLIGVISLSEEMFVDKKMAKSILILRKKTNVDDKVDNFLIASLPDASDRDSFKNILDKIDKYFDK